LHHPKCVRTLDRDLELRASLADLEAQIHRKRADRVAELKALSEASKSSGDKLQALTMKPDELTEVDDRCVQEEEQELGRLKEQLRESGEAPPSRISRASMPAAPDTGGRRIEDQDPEDDRSIDRDIFTSTCCKDAGNYHANLKCSEALRGAP
jgi:hypothetical protein